MEKLRVIPPFEFENWAVIALGGMSVASSLPLDTSGHRPDTIAAAPRKPQRRTRPERTLAIQNLDWPDGRTVNPLANVSVFSKLQLVSVSNKPSPVAKGDYSARGAITFYNPHEEREVPGHYREHGTRELQTGGFWL